MYFMNISDALWDPEIFSSENGSARLALAIAKAYLSEVFAKESACPQEPLTVGGFMALGYKTTENSEGKGSKRKRISEKERERERQQEETGTIGYVF